MTKEDTQEALHRLQLIEQNVQQFLMQKQQFKSQLNELESALNELKETPEAYKIVGNIMVKSSQESLTEELTNKKEMVELRISTLEKQEHQLQEKAETLRKEVMKKLEEK